MTSAINVIPPMTHPLGRHWEQPSKNQIDIDGVHATMSKKSFDLLREYSSTLPSGVYEGKMWKCCNKNAWLLCWYDVANDGDPNKCSIKTRKILIQELIDLIDPPTPMPF